MPNKPSNRISSQDESKAIKHILNLTKDLGRELKLNKQALDNISEYSLLEKDLGFDSLGRVELVSRIEKSFKKTLPEKAYSKIDTPKQLLEELLKDNINENFYFQQNKKINLLNEADEFIPFQNCSTLIEILKWHAENNPKRLHIIFYSDEESKQKITYSQLYNNALIYAKSLKELGFSNQERVAIMLPSTPEYFYTFLGIMLAGGIPVPVYPPTRMSQIREHVLRHEKIFKSADTVFLITTHEIKALGSLLKIKVLNIRRILTPSELSQSTGKTTPILSESNQIAFLQFTSGSTGEPKGVSLTHNNLISNMKAIKKALRLNHTDVVISWLPLYHDMGLIGTWMCSLSFGMPLVLMSPLQFLAKPERWLWACHRYRGTILTAPNFAYELCLKRIKNKDIEGLDLSSCRVSLNGAEPVSPKTLSNFNKCFQNHSFSNKALIPAYGLAENTVALTFPPIGREPLIKIIDRQILMTKGVAIEVDNFSSNALEIVSCGFPIEGCSIRIVDDKDNELEEKRVGTIQFKGSSATKGYFNNSVKTKELYHGDWLDTGDIGLLFDGELYITGRVKDIIIKAGRNISPHELEEIVGEIEKIRKGCVVVFSVTNTDSGTEKLVIVAETRENDPVLKVDLIKKINALTVDLLGTSADDVCLVAPHLVLKTSSGKIRRKSCKEKYIKGDYKEGHRNIKTNQIISLMLLASSYVAGKIKMFFLILFKILYFIYVWPIFLIFFSLIWLWIILVPWKLKWWGIRWGVKSILFITFIPLKINGLEKIKDVNEEFLFVSNHASYLDGPLLAASLMRPVSFVAKQELIKNPIMKLMLAPLETVYVNRQDAQQAVEQFKKIKEKSKFQHSELLFFPEGTFTPVPGLKSFHMGAFSIAAELGIKVIPITIQGSRKVLNAKASWFPMWGKVEIFIHDPIDSQSVKKDHADLWETAKEIRNQAREIILADLIEPDLAPDHH